MTLEFENAIAIQPLENSGSGLQFQNTIYIQPKDEGGDTPTGVGDAYIASTGQKFTGTTFSEALDLFTPDNTQVIPEFTLNKPFKFNINNVIIKDSATSFRSFISYGTNPAIGKFQLALISGVIKLWCNFSTLKRLDIINFTDGNSYDFEIGYNGSGTLYAKAKLSSNTSWTQQTYSYTISSGYTALNVCIGTEDTIANIKDLKIECDGNILFERT